MTKPEWVYDVPAVKFYSAPGFECPKCFGQLLFLDLEVLMASDIMFDNCPNCDTYIVLNLLSTPVYVEGFEDATSWQLRGKELAKKGHGENHQ